MLCVLLHLVEEGADWPQGMDTGGAAFLEKDPDRRGSPVNVRILLIGSARLLLLDELASFIASLIFTASHPAPFWKYLIRP